MVRYRRKQLHYGLSPGVIAFTAGWAVIAIVTSTRAFESIPRWQSTLWVYLGTHRVELSDVHQGGLGLDTVQPVEVAGVPSEMYILPVVAVAGATAYTCYELRTTRLKRNVSNALAAGAGYFLTALVAILISNMQPTISSILGIALVVGGGIWIGSTLLGSLSGGLPFFGIASLGTITAIGILAILGGMAIISALLELIVITFGVAAIVGSSFGVSRNLEKRGNRKPGNVEFPRVRGLQLIVENYWLQILILLIVLVTLVYGISGNTIEI